MSVRPHSTSVSLMIMFLIPLIFCVPAHAVTHLLEASHTSGKTLLSVCRTVNFLARGGKPRDGEVPLSKKRVREGRRGNLSFMWPSDTGVRWSQTGNGSYVPASGDVLHPGQYYTPCTLNLPRSDSGERRAMAAVQEQWLEVTPLFCCQCACWVAKKEVTAPTAASPNLQLLLLQYTWLSSLCPSHCHSQSSEGVGRVGGWGTDRRVRHPPNSIPVPPL